ncbi:hypothetical protein [Flavobacterium sp.]|uniref:hypothetical protein n=1 Tax=Flavobacterium sp. TaxID=239 RepID=UPI00262F6558|nr:hypothetical protein [Flavobacterium sp.]
MKVLTPTQKLNNAIALLEQKQKEEFQDVKNQFDSLIETVKPVNLLNRTLKDFNTPETKTNLINSVTSIASGYISRKLLVGESTNIFKKLAGYTLQYAVTNFISKKIN